MKKLIAGIIALTMTAALITGCGKTEGSADDSKDSTSKASKETTASADEKAEGISDNDGGDSEQEEKPDDTKGSEESKADDDKKDKDKDKDKDKNNDPQASDYESVIYAYYEAENDLDIDKLFHLMYPDDIVEFLFSYSEMSGIDIDEILAQEDIKNNHYEVSSITVEGEATADELDGMMSSFDMLSKLAGLVEKYGDLENLTDEQREEATAILLGGDETGGEHKYKITECYDVKVDYLVNGEPDKDYFYVFYIDGEGWKLDNSMRKYVEKSRESMANANAKSLFNASFSALVDMEETGADVFGAYIVSSDSGKNVSLPAKFDADKFIRETENYFPDLSDYDYFVIINNDGVVYSALCKKDGGNVGTYPVNSVPSSVGKSSFATDSADIESYTLDEIYDTAKKLLK